MFFCSSHFAKTQKTDKRTQDLANTTVQRQLIFFVCLYSSSDVHYPSLHNEQLSKQLSYYNSYCFLFVYLTPHFTFLLYTLNSLQLIRNTLKVWVILIDAWIPLIKLIYRIKDLAHKLMKNYGAQELPKMFILCSISVCRWYVYSINIRVSNQLQLKNPLYPTLA